MLIPSPKPKPDRMLEDGSGLLDRHCRALQGTVSFLGLGIQGRGSNFVDFKIQEVSAGGCMKGFLGTFN